MAEDLLSIAKCAERLTRAGDQVTRSSLSRYVKNHGLMRDRKGREALVSFAEVRAHRKANPMRTVMRGEDLNAAPPPGPTPAPAAPLFDAPPPDQAAPKAPAAAPRSQPGLDGAGEGAAVVEPQDPDEDGGDPKVTPINPRLRREEALARKIEREELEELGRLVPVEEVTAGLADALAAMRQHAKANLRDAAARAAAELGLEASKIPALRRCMQAYHRTVEERFADEMAKLERATGEAKSEARARLDRVTAFALKTRGLRQTARALERA